MELRSWIPSLRDLAEGDAKRPRRLETMGRSKKRDAWADWCAPGAMEAEDVLEAPEPAPSTHLEPLFPLGGLPFTPTSECPHWCRRCSGSGIVGVDEETGAPIECPDCLGDDLKGTGESRPGGDFVCMVCDAAGKDGTPALPLDVKPLPPGPSIAQQRASRREAARERARLEAYVAKGLKLLEGKHKS